MSREPRLIRTGAWAPGAVREEERERILARLVFKDGDLQVTCACGAVYVISNIGSNVGVKCPGCRAVIFIDRNI
jgi:hypothetical protein